MKKTYQKLTAMMLSAFITISGFIAPCSVNAEETSNVSIVEMEQLFSEKDNSDMNVIVTNNENDVVYQGRLGDYDEGKWSYIDFDTLDMLLVWDFITNQSVSICPLMENTNVNILTDVVDETDVNTELEYGIRKIEIKKADGTKVNTLQNNASITSVVVVKKTPESSPATIFAALYDNGILKKVVSADILETQTMYYEEKYNLNLQLNEITENSSLKIMIWDGITLQSQSVPLSVFSGYTINVSTTENQLYTIPVISNSTARKYTVKFNSDDFQIDNLCKEADLKITSPGTATENIRIDEVTQNSFTFTFLGEIQECVNYISMKALKNGNSTIRIFELDSTEEENDYENE